jgi:hypothetical protein
MRLRRRALLFGLCCTTSSRLAAARIAAQALWRDSERAHPAAPGVVRQWRGHAVPEVLAGKAATLRLGRSHARPRALYADSVNTGVVVSARRLMPVQLEMCHSVGRWLMKCSHLISTKRLTACRNLLFLLSSAHDLGRYSSAMKPLHPSKCVRLRST